MPKERTNDSIGSEYQKYFRIKNMMERYSCSRGHISNLVKKGALPPPMILNNVKQWPVAVIDALDKKRDQEYFKMLQDNGFIIPEIFDE
jgi:hypothetical protein